MIATCFSFAVATMSGQLTLSSSVFATAEDVSESAAGSFWIFILGVVGFLFVYAAFMRRLRRRVVKPPETFPHKAGTFSSVELERYSRHIMLREIGGEGQRKLKHSRVAVVGAGGLGSPALLYLAAAGIGMIRIIDDDCVELSNLQRQIIHTDGTVGQNKAESAARAIRFLNPHVVTEPIEDRLDSAHAEMLDDIDIVLDGSDNFATRSLVNRICIEKNISLVSGAISQWEGQVTVVDPGHDAPCMECLFPVQPSADLVPSCAEAGVMGALPGIVGSMMATEAIKVLTSAGAPLHGRLLIYDALWGETRVVKYGQRPDCSVCSAKRARLPS